MEYGEFKERLLAELKNFYGVDAEVEVRRTGRGSGQGYDGLYITLKGENNDIIPVIAVEMLYEDYVSEGTDMDGCVEKVYRMREGYECPEDIRLFAECIMDWDSVRENVYPVLLSADKNRERSDGMVSMPVLDLLAAYVIRGKIRGTADASVTVTEKLLCHYGINREELHRQALENMERDAYCFRSMDSVVEELADDCMADLKVSCRTQWREMYILTNSMKRYGAAGILNRKLVRDFAEGRSFYILPSSVHETLFVPVSAGDRKETLDQMVADVNAEYVLPEERLTDHAYYYDGEADEIRMEI